MNHELVHAWVDALSSHLDRPKADILKRGLAATDFREDIEITFPDQYPRQLRWAGRRLARVNPAKAGHGTHEFRE